MAMPLGLMVFVERIGNLAKYMSRVRNAIYTFTNLDSLRAPTTLAIRHIGDVAWPINGAR